MFLIFVGLLFVSACGQESLDEQHAAYLAKKGWKIEESIEVETYIVEIPDEMLRNYEASGITFFSEYLGKEVTQHSYQLKEEDVEGKRLKAVVFERKVKLLGVMALFQIGTPVYLIWTIKNVSSMKK